MSVSSAYPVYCMQWLSKNFHFLQMNREANLAIGTEDAVPLVTTVYYNNVNSAHGLYCKPKVGF